MKGHRGFKLTKEEIINGITAAGFMKGFVVNEDVGTFEWNEVMPVSSYNCATKAPRLTAIGPVTLSKAFSSAATYI